MTGVLHVAQGRRQKRLLSNRIVSEVFFFLSVVCCEVYSYCREWEKSTGDTPKSGTCQIETLFSHVLMIQNTCVV